jgi:uncharacterized protein
VDSFAPLAASSTALLTTFRASGEGVATPVSIALEGGRAYFVTAADTGKVKRLAREPRVTLAPCTVSGKVVGETVSGQARTLPVHGVDGTAGCCDRRGRCSGATCCTGCGGRP